MVLLLAGVPFACAYFGGHRDLFDSVCQFPPRTEDFHLHPERLWNVRRPFNWWVFAAMAAFVTVNVWPFVKRAWRALAQRRSKGRGRVAVGVWPWWGWLGLVVLAAGWIMSWTRFEWFRSCQVMCSYFPIWMGFIISLNAWCVKRAGTSPLTAHPLAYLMTFPVSSVFWWFFEYLNRYVWNWYYVGISELTAAEYVVYATLCFSSVLPAVMAIAAILRTFAPFKDEVYQGMAKFNLRSPAWCAFYAGWAAIGLVGIVFFPDYAYPFLWMSPLAAFVLIQVLLKEESIIDRFALGDWSVYFRYSIASLLCGLCWETWNFYAFAKWIYAVPWVHGWQLWEMPLLGFAGYLPFGVECAAIIAWLYGTFGLQFEDTVE